MLDTIVIVVLSIGLAALGLGVIAFFVAYFVISLPMAIFGLTDEWGNRIHRTHHRLTPAH